MIDNKLLRELQTSGVLETSDVFINIRPWIKKQINEALL